MTLVYVVLCDIAGETFPVAVCPDAFSAQALADRLNAKAATRAEQIGLLALQFGRPGFSVAEAPAVDLAGDLVLTLVDRTLDLGDARMAATYAATLRRGIKLGEKL